ncbi:MAG: Fe-S protein radical family [Bryobacterales bacterium]|nr:Fe-S protein radical family [Bryobacterales bacterium]
MLATRSRKVVLFLPPYAGQILGPPLGLLSLAGSLREAGYQACIVDGALDRDFRDTVAREIEDCLCFGVSLLTGPMIIDSVEISRMVRRLRPELPIVFGGWHPTLLSRQTLREGYVDIVVRHQGEKTLIEILQRLEAGRSLDLVAGCWFKRDGQIVINPDRPAASLSSLPAPAYDLVDFDAYERAGGIRKLPYATSTGCPYACNYCTDMVFYNRRFNPYDTAQVVAELVELVRKYALSEIALLDSNFLVDVRRALAIAEGIAASGVGFRWTFQASTDLLCRMADDDVKLLARSGVSHIGFGVESGSPEVLRLMNKAHEHIPDMYEAARKCANAGIRVTYNLIFGFPGEEKDHRKETLSVMADIAERFDNVSFSPNVFTPYPGIPIWPRLRELGMSEPESLAEWADVDLGGTSLPWLQGEPFETLQRGISYFLLDSQINKTRRKSRSRAYQFLLRLTRKPLLWRLRNYAFKWPVELALCVAQRWLTVRRSLLTGQALSHNLVRTR